MIDRQRKTVYQFGYGVSFCLMGSALIFSAVIISAIADAATKSIPVTDAAEVWLEETEKETNSGDTGINVPIGDFVVTVVRGDSLSSILRTHLGSLRALREVTRYNKLDTPDMLEPGKKILIPVYLFPTATDTSREATRQTPESKEEYLVVDLADLSSVAESDATLQSTESDEEYLVVDLASLASTTNAETTLQTTESEAQFLAVDLEGLSSVAESGPTLQSTESDDEYLVVDLSGLASAANTETTLQTAESEEQFLTIDLADLSSTADPEVTLQSTESEEQYLVVDLAVVNTTPDRRVRVNRGDSLSSILRENLGSLRALKEVARYNNLETPDVLAPGQIILIPGNL